MRANTKSAPPTVALVTDLDGLAAALVERLSVLESASRAEQEPYWTAEKAAEYISADKQRIYDLRSQRRLRCVKDGSRLLTRRSWLDAYLEGQG